MQKRPIKRRASQDVRYSLYNHSIDTRTSSRLPAAAGFLEFDFLKNMVIGSHRVSLWVKDFHWKPHACLSASFQTGLDYAKYLALQVNGRSKITIVVKRTLLSALEAAPLFVPSIACS